MSEKQLLKAAGPQQYNVYKFIKEGRTYKEYRFTEPRAGFGSYALVEAGRDHTLLIQGNFSNKT